MLVLHHILLTEQRLRGVQRQAVGRVVGVAAGQAGVDLVVLGIAAQVDVGQQSRTPLDRLLLASLVGGAGGGILRIVGLRVLEDGGQVFCVGGWRQGKGESERQGFELHGVQS